MIIAIINTLKYQFKILKEIDTFEQLINIVIATPIIYTIEKYKILKGDKKWK